MVVFCTTEPNLTNETSSAKLILSHPFYAAANCPGWWDSVLIGKNQHIILSPTYWKAPLAAPHKTPSASLAISFQLSGLQLGLQASLPVQRSYCLVFFCPLVETSQLTAWAYLDNNFNLKNKIKKKKPSQSSAAAGQCPSCWQWDNKKNRISIRAATPSDLSRTEKSRQK